jgi:hypothetical protein
MNTPDPASGPQPSLPLRLGFWLLLGMFSTGFAEVVSGSQPFPFFQPWGIIVVTPLYTLHILVLTTVIVRFRMLTWQGLCFAGALFGLYEACITKVLWDPPWGQEVALSFAGVAWAHVVLLVLWWHPLVAFFVPLLLAETLLTGSRSVLGALPQPVRDALTTGRRPLHWTLGFAVCCGLVTSGSPATIAETTVSIATNGLLLILLIALWRARGRGTRYSMESLLPGRTGLVVCAALLAALYAITGPLLLPDSLPGADGYLAIGMLYAVLAAGLLRCRAFYRPAASGDIINPAVSPVWPVYVIFLATYAIVAACSELILGAHTVAFMMLNWLVGGVIGLYVYGRALYSLRSSVMATVAQAHR